MVNSTQVTYFTFTAYFDIRNFRYLFFLIVMCLYMLIICSNLLLIVVICVNRSLHEPMYMFLCSLFVNELYGSTGLFPFLLLQILSDIHTVSTVFCFLQVYCLHTYAGVEFSSLAVMSYDRYLAICFPLQYNTYLTLHKAVIISVVIWVYSLLKFLITLSLNIRLTLCGNIMKSLFCTNHQITKLACSDTQVNEVDGLFGVVHSVIIPLLLILFSYVKILKICLSGCKQTRQKALSTCTPHLASLINFSFGCLFEIIQSRYDMSSVPRMLSVILSLYFVVLQPLLNPIIYGMQMSKIRNTCKNLLTCKMLTCH